MNIDWIEDFLALYETGNFTRAAERRHTTQPAFSRRIQQLEFWAGGNLFNRDMRPITLTASGASFLTRAHRIRDEILDARRLVKVNMSHLNSAKKIYTVNTLATHFFPNFLTERTIENFSLVTVSTTGVIEALKRGRADYGLIPRFSKDMDLADLKYEVVGQDKIVMVNSKRKPTPIRLEKRTLKGDFLMYKPGTSIGSQIKTQLCQNSIALEKPPVCEAEASESLCALAEQGLGVTWIPKILLNSNLTEICLSTTLEVNYEILWITK